MTKGTKAFRITISILLALSIIGGALMTVIFMFFATNYVHRDDYGIWVAGVLVTRENHEDILGNGKVIYNPSSNTLIFENAVIETHGAVIQSEIDLRIKLIGENKFVCTGGDYIPAIYAADYSLDKDLSFEGDGSLTLEIQNVTSNVQGIVAGNLIVSADITITTPDCQNVVNGIVCGASLLVTSNTSVTVNNGAGAGSTGVRVLGNAFFEEGSVLNVSVNPGAVDTCRGLSVNGDLIMGKDVSLTVSVDDESAKVGECVRVTGLLEVGFGATLTASAKKNHAIECYGSILAKESSTVSATTAGEASDIFCCGAVINYGATVNAEIKTFGGEHNESVN